MGINKLLRCNETKEFLDYAKYGQQLDPANDTEIFSLTGCLSKCHKFSFTAQARSELKEKECSHPSKKTLELTFGFPSGQHEIREQA